MITPKELEIAKDISIEFHQWLESNTHFYFNDKRTLFDYDDLSGSRDKVMTLSELFDYYVHEILTEIELNKLFNNGKQT